jgi:hypothetical protein
MRLLSPRPRWAGATARAHHFQTGKFAVVGYGHYPHLPAAGDLVLQPFRIIVVCKIIIAVDAVN